jgi:hypothetical protein
VGSSTWTDEATIGDTLTFFVHDGAKSIVMAMSPDDYVRDLVHTVMEELAEKPVRLRLTFHGKYLKAHLTLQQSNIQVDDTVRITNGCLLGGGKRARGASTTATTPRRSTMDSADRKTQQIREMEMTERCISPAGMADPLISTCVAELRKIRDNVTTSPGNHFNTIMSQTDPTLLKDLSTISMVKNDETRYIMFAKVLIGWMHNKVTQVISDLEYVESIMRLTMEYAYTSAYATDNGQVSHVNFQMNLTTMLMKMPEQVGAQNQKNAQQVAFETALATAIANVRQEMAAQVQAAVQSGNLADLGLPATGQSAASAAASGAADGAPVYGPANQIAPPMAVDL